MAGTSRGQSGRVGSAGYGNPTRIRRALERNSRQEEPITPSKVDSRTFVVEGGELKIRKGIPVNAINDNTDGTILDGHLPRVVVPALPSTSSSNTTYMLVEGVSCLRDAVATLAKEHNRLLQSLKAKGVQEE